MAATTEKERETKTKKKTMNKRLSRARANGSIFSRHLTVSTSKKRTLKSLLTKCARHIYHNNFDDDLKAPVNCEATSAKLAPAAFNVYYGENKESTNDPNTVMRAAYGFGSGATSIGLDPRTMRLYPFFPDLIKLKKQVTTLVKSDPAWKHAMAGREFDSCSLKVYYWTQRPAGNWIQKKVDWHVDVSRNADGIPYTNNSQVPNTPVAIVTFGHTKTLEMRKHASPTQFQDTSTVHFQQANSSVFVLDGRDECVRNGFHWRHRSMATGNAKSNSHEVTFSFLFRITQMMHEVNVHDNTMVNKACGVKKMKQFERAHPKTFNSKHYNQACAFIHQNVEGLFNHFA
jgi:hypothetical protein